MGEPEIEDVGEVGGEGEVECRDRFNNRGVAVKAGRGLANDFA